MIRHPEGGEAAKDLLSCHPDLVAGKALKLSGSLRAPFFECAGSFAWALRSPSAPQGAEFLNKAARFDENAHNGRKNVYKGRKIWYNVQDQAKMAEKACGSVKYTGKGSGAYAAARCGGGHRRGHRHA